MYVYHYICLLLLFLFGLLSVQMKKSAKCQNFKNKLMFGLNDLLASHVCDHLLHLELLSIEKMLVCIIRPKA